MAVKHVSCAQEMKEQGVAITTGAYCVMLVLLCWLFASCDDTARGTLSTLKLRMGSSSNWQGRSCCNEHSNFSS